jgi:hypothetical protein
MSSPEPPPEGLAEHVIPRGPELPYNKEPLIIGSENCFGDAVELPPEVRDRGILEFAEGGEVLPDDDEIKAIMSKAAALLEKQFVPMMDEMMFIGPPSLEDMLRSTGLDPDKYVVLGSEWRDGTLHLFVGQKTPIEYIYINLSKIGDEDATDGEAGREVQG